MAEALPEKDSSQLLQPVLTTAQKHHLSLCIRCQLLRSVQVMAARHFALGEVNHGSTEDPEMEDPGVY